MAAAALEVVLTWISWYGQSAIRIEYPSPEGVKIVWIDPYKIQVSETADLVLVTHPHQDHLDPGSLARLVGPRTIVIGPADIASRQPGALVLKPGESKDLGWTRVEAVPAYNVKKSNHKKDSLWLGFVLTLDGRRIWHAGDTERIPEMKTLKVDLAMVPLGQTYTMGTVDEAAAAVLDSGAQMAIPIHYGMYEGSAADALTFKHALAGRVKVAVLPVTK